MKDKTQILFVMDGMQVGGVENALISVLRNIDYNCMDVDLLLLHDYLALIDELDEHVNIRKLDSAYTGKSSFKFLFYYGMFKVCTLLKREQRYFWQKKMQCTLWKKRSQKVLQKTYDIVIGYKQGEPEDFVANCISAKKKVAFYHHGSLIDEELHAKTYAQMDVIVAVSEGVRDLLTDRYPQFASKIQVISNYVDCQRIYDKSKSFFVDNDSGKTTICTVGRLAPEKRYDLVIETAKVLVKTLDKPFVWYCIGEGEERKKIEEQIYANDLQENVILLGEVKNPLPYVLNCDVYVQTSDAESYGLAIKEALVLGKQVVSTMTIGGQLLVTHKGNGYLSQSESQSLCEGIEWCLHNKATNFMDRDLYLQEDREIKSKWEKLLQNI